MTYPSVSGSKKSHPLGQEVAGNILTPKDKSQPSDSPVTDARDPDPPVASPHDSDLQLAVGLSATGAATSLSPPMRREWVESTSNWTRAVSPGETKCPERQSDRFKRREN